MYGATFPSTESKDKKDVINADDPRNKNLISNIINNE